MVKKCTRCKSIKRITDFHRHPTGADGRRSVCIVCRKLQHHENYLKRKENNEAKEKEDQARACTNSR